MALEGMELASAKFDAMISILKRPMKAGRKPKAPEDMARYQQLDWNGDAEVAAVLTCIRNSWGNAAPPVYAS